MDAYTTTIKEHKLEDRQTKNYKKTMFKAR